MPTPTSPPAVRRRLTVQGVVQGVGFRPFVYGLAQRCGVGGLVGNDSGGVFIEVEGTPEAVAAFERGLVAEAPPLAVIEQVTGHAQPPRGDAHFVIVYSRAQTAANTLISADIATCPDCLADLRDPANRRYRYPFTNCTNCGPRFTIIRDIPYDRPQTTMAAFPLCPACRAEYDDPLNRRFHAQPNACPDCGPHVWLERSGAPETVVAARDDAVRAACRLLADGHIVAVKGVGGFHLACDAADDAAVAALRARKGRVDKPFAVMAADLAAARRIAHIDAPEAALLCGRERPIVLLRRREDAPLSRHVAPGQLTVGVMLPYTPLHELLFSAESPHPSAPPVLVMTSGNLADEPIVKDNAAARERLAPLADALLLHDRDIHVWCDDSVLRVWRGRELPVRRSRGYAPYPVALAQPLPPVLAVGGELKATFCLTKGRHAFMSQHIGDMENLETLDAFSRAVNHFRALFRVEPQAVVCDLHPGYLATRWAQANPWALPVIPVQHHHAHIAAVMAENGLDGQTPVVGFSFDGTGYGTDGTIWGGELLRADYAGFERLAYLAPVPLPGGDAAVKRPYRSALAHLWAAGVAWDARLPCVAACPPVERGVVQRQLATGLNSPPTSSMGRLFDAVAALIGVRQTVTYEAQAAIELEVGVDSAESATPYAFDLDGPTGIDAAPVIRALAADVLAGVPPAVCAARFHHAVADLILALSVRQCAAHGAGVIALSGGVMQNVTLLEQATARLERAGFTVLTHRRVPPNDGGLALGQAMIGAAALARTG